MIRFCTILCLYSVFLWSCQSGKHDAVANTTGLDTVKTDSGVTVIKNKEGKIVQSYPTALGPSAAKSPNTPGEKPGAVGYGGLHQGPYYIKGTLIGGEGGNITLDKLGIGNDIKPLYVETVNSEAKFGFDGYCAMPQLMQLRLPAGVVHFIVRPNDTIDFTMTLNKPGEWKVKGSLESQQLLDMYNILEDANAEKDKISTRLEQAKKDLPLYSHLSSLMPAQYNAIDKVKRANLEKFITKIDTSFVGILAGMYLDPVVDIEFLKGLDKKYVLLYPSSPFYQALHEKVATYAPVSMGMVAPEIISQDPNGKTIKLSSLRGKYVLIDFWASWCAPCRAETPNLRKAYEKYKSKGLEILSYSVDKDKALWTKAIADDKMDWTNLSDLLAFQSAGAQTYLITEIPNNFLLDKDGHIVAKNLRGADLMKKLAQVIK